MGRTLPTFTMVIQQEMESWAKFRRGLRREDQQALDELFRAARLQLAGSAYAARPIPFESIAMSMLLAQHRAITHLEERLAGLEGAHGAAGGDDGDHHRLAV
jgi:ABC-type uncharacterized transport system ATPase subunit